jgi:ribosomal protein S18 acetylase RimI-like enzyme
MKIMEFSEEHRGDVIALWKEANLAVPWNDPSKDIDRKLKVNPELFLVGVLEDELIATVMGGYEGHRGWINYLAVSPGHRRKGYGRQMMAAVETKIRRLGCPKINLQVRQSNTEVIQFYQALGYGDDRVVGLGKRLVMD